MLKQCSCKSAFQDAEYGASTRLHTTGLKGGSTCTVCGTKTTGSAPAAAKAAPEKKGK